MSSTSSRYLNYNSINDSARKGSEVRKSASRPTLADGAPGEDGISQFNHYASLQQSAKINNFNDYMHVFSEKGTNDANVQWIVKLRNYEQKNDLANNALELEDLENESPTVRRDTSKSRLTDINPPSVYYKGASHVSKKVVPDFHYKGNHLDVLHLSTKRLGPTPHLS